MATERSVEMGADERNEFLGTGGTGVVSFQTADTDPPYSLPVSYGYDRETGTFYFRLAFGRDSGKRAARLDRPASFVVFDDRDGRWKSVVATGTLEELDGEGADEESVDTAVLNGMRRIHIPLYDVFEEESRDVPFRFFALEPQRLTGRKEARTDD